jgi:hypothetical protein
MTRMQSAVSSPPAPIAPQNPSPPENEKSPAGRDWNSNPRRKKPLAKLARRSWPDPTPTPTPTPRRARGWWFVLLRRRRAMFITLILGQILITHRPPAAPRARPRPRPLARCVAPVRTRPPSPRAAGRRVRARAASAVPDGPCGAGGCIRTRRGSTLPASPRCVGGCVGGCVGVWVCACASPY